MRQLRGGVERERSARGVMADVKITPAKVADPDSSYVTRRKTAELPGLQAPVHVFLIYSVTSSFCVTEYFLI